MQEETRRLFRQQQQAQAAAAAAAAASSAGSTAAKPAIAAGLNGGLASGGATSSLPRYAVQTSSGTLYCTICDMSVKSELLWPAHANGKKHKEAIASANQATASSNAARSKRPAEQEADEGGHDSKRSRSALPADFFGSGNGASHGTEEPAATKTALPTGFFDDADRDAKAHNEPTAADKFEAEWASFSKAIAEETSQTPATDEHLHADDDNEWLERERERLTEQEWNMRKVARFRDQYQSHVQRLQQQGKQSAAAPPQAMSVDNGATNEGDESDDDDEANDPDAVHNWRMKSSV
ncbi:hypothetical protein CAOG_05978 [Capsaspora owczarzaki ATCC 30864]|uniref:hypothetical protein n=1 Tax=Capsaspora owczarzaki (strain ATCC 30864) TaxID=595528 RepID=UPI00035258F3|nr:hypothetical protein CAOG_05978 [Capsaspora owczarzaki ATCC 30864]|eukprot:XP_004345568.2 hypothetical protein CAOG_05978 [Capsaspora owczarzaki ATCC 30864]